MTRRAPTRGGDGLRWTLPVFRSLEGYRPAWLRQDLVAGVLIVAIAIPLSMGMAEVAGMPPVAGLYSCVLPLVAYALLGSSRQLVISLDASTAAMLAAAVVALGAGVADPSRYVALAALATILVGTILVVAGIGRLGFLGNFLSEPVLLGYQAGLAIVVTATQLPRLLGVSVTADTTLGQYAELLGNLSEINIPTMIVGVGCLAVIALARGWKPAVPGALIAIVGATVVVEAFDLGARGVAVLGILPSGLPTIGWPSFTASDLAALLPSAAAIALIAAADTIVSSRAFAQRGGYPVDPNEDLIGLGAANLSSGISGGITVSASAARTAVVESVGSHSQVASVTAAILMALVLVFLTRPLENVPVTSLAAVVIAAVVRLIEVRSLRRLLRERPTEFVVAIATTLGAVLIGLLQGILIAVLLMLIDFVRRATRPHDCVVGRIQGHRGTFDVRRYPEAKTEPGIVVYRFDAPLFAANAERFRQRVRSIVGASPGTEWFVVEASAVSDIDATAARMLQAMRSELEEVGVTLVFVEVLGGVLDQLDRYGLTEQLGPGHILDTAEDAHAAFDTRGR